MPHTTRSRTQSSAQRSWETPATGARYGSPSSHASVRTTYTYTSEQWVHGLCESVARFMFPLASTHTDTPPAYVSTVTGTLPNFERSTYAVTQKHSQLRNRGCPPQRIAGGSDTLNALYDPVIC